ncbi:uncharacterized protein LOC120334373 [Styela clava]
MKLFTLVIFATCVVLSSANMKNKKMPFPACITKEPPLENPMKCTQFPQSVRCLHRWCTFTAEKGMIWINNKFESVELAKKIKEPVEECGKAGQKCSGHRCPCKCKTKGKWISRDGVVKMKIDGKWVKSVLKPDILIRVPGGCTCTEPDD